MAKVYDLCQREGSAGPLGIGIPHVIAVCWSSGQGCAQREPKRANVDQGHAWVLHH